MLLDRLVFAGATLALFVGCGLMGCGPPPPTTQTPDNPPASSAVVHRSDSDAPPLQFSCTAMDGSRIGSQDFRGRVTVVAMLTSYDPASLVEAHYVAELAHEHTPRINVVTMFLEPADNRPLVDAFSHTLHLPSPCLADADTIAGKGTLSGLNFVPSVVVADKQGREKSRKISMSKKDEIEKMIRDAE